jgi:hypothetical protein
VASDLEFGLGILIQVLLEGSLDRVSLLVRSFVTVGFVLEHRELHLLVGAILIEIVLDVVEIGVHFSEVLNDFEDLRLLILEIRLELLEFLLVVDLDLHVLLWGHGVITNLDEIVLLLLNILSLQFLQIGVDFAEVGDNFHDLLLGRIEFGLQFLNSLGGLLLGLDLSVSMELSGGLFASLDTGFGGRSNLLESFLLSDEFLLLHGLLLELGFLVELLLGVLFEDVVR